MADWDRNSPQLEANLTAVLRQARDVFRARGLPTLALMKQWHADMMNGLDPDGARYVGAFRGEPGIAHDVYVGSNAGTPFAQVASEVARFETQLLRAVAYLDAQLAIGTVPTDAQQREVISLCAWAHFEWVRIHPFMNGNGRTARLWVNALAMRYGMPPFLKLRPRPDHPYGRHASDAMRGGDWHDLIAVFDDMYQDTINPA
jgi:fido (protein-threonine AMPylation protein)